MGASIPVVLPEASAVWIGAPSLAVRLPSVFDAASDGTTKGVPPRHPTSDSRGISQIRYSFITASSQSEGHRPALVKRTPAQFVTCAIPPTTSSRNSPHGANPPCGPRTPGATLGP